MKVLYLIPRFITAGAERLVLEYARRLPEFGYEVAVASVRGGGELVEEFNKIKKNSPRLFGEDGETAFWRRMNELNKFIESWQPDIIHSHIFSADAAGYLIKRKFGIPWISTQHNGAQSVSGLRQLVLRRALRWADRVVAVSENVAEDIKKYWRVDERHVSLITNGIDLAQACPHCTSSRALLLERRRRLLFAIVGRLEEQKGHDILFRALAHLIDLPWDLHIYGDGALRGELENLARELAINERMHWHGVVTDMPPALSHVDCVIAPSRFEGMSLAVMEAMAAGCIVIASEAAGTGLIEDKMTGLIVPNENVEALTRTLKFVIQERQKLADMPDRARVYAQDNFRIEKHINQLRHIYEEIKQN